MQNINNGVSLVEEKHRKTPFIFTGFLAGVVLCGLFTAGVQESNTSHPTTTSYMDEASHVMTVTGAQLDTSNGEWVKLPSAGSPVITTKDGAWSVKNDVITFTPKPGRNSGAVLTPEIEKKLNPKGD